MATTMTVQGGPGIGRNAVPAAEWRAIWFISIAHCVAHYYTLALIPLFVLLKTMLNVNFVQLGFAITVYNVVSVIAQTPVGFLVDHVGSRKLLVGALLLGGVAFMSFPLMPTYAWLLVVMAFVGLANAVYHPADYDLLNSAIAPSRVGRAFSYHTFSGYVGFGIAPPLMIWLGTSFGVSTAFVVAGAIGIVAAVPLLFASELDRRPQTAAEKAAAPPQASLRSLLTPSILSLTLFFVLLNLSMSGVQNFSIIALQELYHIPLALTSAALTVFLTGIALGVLGGGVIADKTKRHGEVAVAGYIACAILIVIVGTFNLGGYAIAAILGLAGFCSGLIMPSRDMLVRRAAPPGAVGRTFGIVTTGFNIGGMVGPMIYGALMDHHHPRDIYYIGAALMLCTAALPYFTQRSEAKAAETTAA